MNNLYTIDLKSARIRAGLLQSDCAHLLDISVETYSQMETGKRQPRTVELCALTLISGQKFEGLFRETYRDARRKLLERLATLPVPEDPTRDSERRQYALSSLREHLLTIKAVGHGG